MGKCIVCGVQLAPNRNICGKCACRAYNERKRAARPSSYCEYCGTLIVKRGNDNACDKCKAEVAAGMYDAPVVEKPTTAKKQPWQKAQAAGYDYGKQMTAALVKQQKREMAARAKKMGPGKGTRSREGLKLERLSQDHGITDTEIRQGGDDMDVKAYRKQKDLTVREVVDVMKRRYESYSNPLQTAVENPDKYGVRLTEDAEDHLIGVFGAPKEKDIEKTDAVCEVVCESVNRPKKDCHKLKGRMSFRMTKTFARRFNRAIKAHGWKSVQDALTDIVTEWLEREESNNEEQ